MFRYRKNLPLDIQHDMARNIKIITSIKISSLIYWMIERKNSKWTIFRREKCSQTLYRQFHSEYVTLAIQSCLTTFFSTSNRPFSILTFDHPVTGCSKVGIQYKQYFEEIKRSIFVKNFPTTLQRECFFTSDQIKY